MAINTIKMDITQGQLTTKFSEIDLLEQRIKELEKPRYSSGYLRSKFG